jgi:isocitrate/methylisocitrate lyase
LRAFVAVADCGGFHRAAERFNLTQSTVSQQIKRLELETERLLFRRKVLVPIAQHIRTLNAARLAADVEGVSTILLCRTDAYSAQLLTSDIDERDRPFLSGERTREGFFRLRPELGLDYAIARSLACAPYADLLWWETSEPDLAEAERFAEAIHRQFPGKMLAYNCSPSFNWRRALAPKKIAGFQRDIAQMGYCFQFVTLAGFHSLNLSMFNLARDYCERGMAAYSELQQAEFSAEAGGYTATRHQREVGVGYFDAIAAIVSGGHSSTTALAGSTEVAQFHQREIAPQRQHGHDEGLVHNHDWAVHDWAADDLAASGE